MKTIGLQLKTKLNLRILVSFIFMGFISFSFAATITSNGSGNWNVPSSWVGNVVPGAGDAVIIANGHTITNNTVITCNSLTINSGGILRASNNFTVNTTTSITGTISNYGSGLKTFTGAVTINSGGSFINESTGNITFSNTVTINSGGTWSGSGTTGNTITLSGAFTNNSSAQTDNSTATYNTANNSNIKNFGLGLSVYNLTSTGVNTTHSGIFTVRNILSTGQFKMGANAILYFSGSNFTSTGDWVGCSNTSTLYMNGSNQTLPGTNYTCKIVIDNNQTVTVGNALTINTSLTVKTGSTFFDGNKSISFISANQLILESGSTFKLSSGNFPNNFTSNTQTGINANSTIELSGTSKIYQTGNTGWLPYAGNITLSGTTTLTHSIGNILVINGNLTINNGCILNFSNIGTITLKGNLTNNGSFTSANNSANRLVLTSGSRVHEISGTGTYATNGINTCIQLNDAFGAQINSGTIITIPTFTQTNGTFTNKGTLTITNAYTLPAANNFIADEGTTTTFNNTILNSGTFKVLCGTNTTIVGVFTNNGTITGPTIIGKWARIINSNAIVGTGSISANSYIAFSKTVTCIKTGSFIEENSSRFSTCVIITTFYSKNNTDLSIPSNWNSAIDGTGLNATTFTSITDTFIVQTQHISTINSNLNIAGTMIVNGTIIPNPTVIISGGTLTGSGNINVTRNIATADFLSQYTETNKILSNLTVEYSNPTGGQTISDVTYGNLKLSNTSGTQIAAGDITITDSLILKIGSTFEIGNYNLNITTISSIDLGANINGTGSIILSGNILFRNINNVSKTILNPNIILNNNVILNVENDTTSIDVIINGIISGAYSITKNSLGTLTLNGQNTFSGATIISNGTIQLGNSDKLPNNSNIVLNSGTLKTGATLGFNETIGTLRVIGNSNIVLGTGNHSLIFANSSSEIWNGSTLTITGWSGIAGNSGSGGKIFVGANGLTTQQLSNIIFDGYIGGAELLGTGEIVPESLLPIELIDFAGSTNENGIILNWETVSEKNNNYFTLFRSLNGIDFNPISEVAGNGNSNTIKEYSYLDNSQNQSIVYYRLSQTDFDGRITYSKIISIINNIHNETFIFSNYGIKVNCNKILSTIKIINIEGKIIYLQTFENMNDVIINYPIGDGVYIIFIEQNNSIIDEEKFTNFRN